ncbi:MAG: hypothetical protein DI621_25010 [Pseudomonas protegens]|nr:MAG: hypothetical protein DI621_25010 [Pseudomonas protegens]
MCLDMSFGVVFGLARLGRSLREAWVSRWKMAPSSQPVTGTAKATAKVLWTLMRPAKVVADIAAKGNYRGGQWGPVTVDWR